MTISQNGQFLAEKAKNFRVVNEAFQIQISNFFSVDGGFAPEWIMLKRDIDKMIVDLREDLHKNCQIHLQRIRDKSDEMWCKRQWMESGSFIFQDDLVSLNKTIDKYNLMVPMIQSQKFHLDLSKEMDKIWVQAWRNCDKKKTEQLVKDQISTPMQSDQEIQPSLFDKFMQFIKK